MEGHHQSFLTIFTAGPASMETALNLLPQNTTLELQTHEITF